MARFSAESPLYVAYDVTLNTAATTWESTVAPAAQGAGDTDAGKTYVTTVAPAAQAEADAISADALRFAGAVIPAAAKANDAGADNQLADDAVMNDKLAYAKAVGTALQSAYDNLSADALGFVNSVATAFQSAVGSVAKDAVKTTALATQQAVDNRVDVAKSQIKADGAALTSLTAHGFGRITEQRGATRAEGLGYGRSVDSVIGFVLNIWSSLARRAISNAAPTTPSSPVAPPVHGGHPIGGGTQADPSPYQKVAGQVQEVGRRTSLGADPASGRYR